MDNRQVRRVRRVRRVRQVEKSIGERLLRSKITPTMVYLERRRLNLEREHEDESNYIDTILSEIDYLRYWNVDEQPFNAPEPDLFQELSDSIVQARSHQLPSYKLYTIQEE